MGNHHDHGHGHGHGHHHHAPEKFNSAFAIAVILNLAYTAIQAGYAFHAHSMSLLADAGHNLGDVLGLILAWGASFLLTKPANDRYSYGFKRSSILTAIINAVILIIACIFIFYESIDKLIHPHPIKEVVVMVVALIGIIVNGGTAMLFMKGSHDDLNIKGAFMHLAYDALVSFGVVIGAIIIYFTGWTPLDPIIGIIIAIVILYGTWGLLKDSLNLIMDGVPRDIDSKQVCDYLKSIDGVTAVHDLHIWGLSTRDTALTAHLVIPNRDFSDDDHHTVADELKHSFKIGHVTLQIEKGLSAHDCHTRC